MLRGTHVRPRPTFRRLVTFWCLGALVVGCSGGDATPAEGAAGAATEDVGDGPHEVAATVPDLTDTPPSDGAAGEGLSVDGRATADVCGTLERIAQAGQELPRPEDRPDTPLVVDHMRRMAAMYDELAPEVRALGSPRDLSRARIVDEVASVTRDLADAMIEEHEGGLLADARLAELEGDVAWLEEASMDLTMWRARNCDDVPGVTHGEINGIPHVHIELEE